MRVEVVRSGGFAGLRMTWVVDDATLDQTDSAELGRLVAAVTAMAPAPDANAPTTPDANAPTNPDANAPTNPGAGGGFDRFVYAIRVSGEPEASAYEARVGEPLPDASRALVDFVASHSTPSAG